MSVLPGAGPDVCLELRALLVVRLVSLVFLALLAASCSFLAFAATRSWLFLVLQWDARLQRTDLTRESPLGHSGVGSDSLTRNPGVFSRKPFQK